MTSREIEYLIWLVLQYEGKLPPMTEETVAYWEKKLQNETIPPDVLNRLDERIEMLLLGIDPSSSG